MCVCVCVCVCVYGPACNDEKWDIPSLMLGVCARKGGRPAVLLRRAIHKTGRLVSINIIIPGTRVRLSSTPPHVHTIRETSSSGPCRTWWPHPSPSRSPGRTDHRIACRTRQRQLCREREAGRWWCRA